MQREDARPDGAVREPAVEWEGALRSRWVRPLSPAAVVFTAVCCCGDQGSPAQLGLQPGLDKAVLQGLQALVEPRCFGMKPKAPQDSCVLTHTCAVCRTFYENRDVLSATTDPWLYKLPF